MSSDLRRRVAINGVSLAWDSFGPPTAPPPVAPRPPLLLCHGFSGSSHDFALVIARLALTREVIAFDHRGHGLSDKLGHESAYSIGKLVDDAAVAIGEIALGPVDLLGHSMGGVIALGVALANPRLVRSLVLMDTSAWAFVDPGDEHARFFEAYMATFDPADGLPDLSGLPNPENALVEAATPEGWRRTKAERDGSFDPYALKSIGTELLTGTTWSLRDRLGEIACPVTVIAGSKDHPLVDQTPALAAEVADGRYVVIEGAYHSPQLTHSDQWCEAVEAHLARVDAHSRA